MSEVDIESQINSITDSYVIEEITTDEENSFYNGEEKWTDRIEFMLKKWKSQIDKNAELHPQWHKL